MINDHKIIDYDIKLNNVIQLIQRAPRPINCEDKVETETPAKKSLIDAQSEYYKIGDMIDVCLEDNGSWYEASIQKILQADDIEDSCAETDLIFKVKSAEHIIPFELDVKFEDIRPRSYYVYKLTEIQSGMVVLANYNIEEPKERGCWYNFKVTEVSRNVVKGTLLLGKDSTPMENCKIKFLDEFMRIEKPVLLTDRKDTDTDSIYKRKYPVNCTKCKDDKNRKCKECGCRICAGKESCDRMILCDECDYGYHTSCLSPPLEAIPEGDWYCPDCKTDDSAIVKAGEKLKESKKKAKMPSNKAESTRDWGKGMACVGRTKECTLVPKNHYGPVPGVDVGTRWGFRSQVSEAGIHRALVAGIHGREGDGAYSLVLSGGYEDDVDNGDAFYYTGSGGRDLSGNKRVNSQSSDQQLTRMNKALAMNCNAPINAKEGAEAKDWKKGKPVRVVRNSNLAKHSKFAPKEGYRYDGIYKVVKYFPEKGKSGFIVWKYLLRRDDPNPAPWEKDGQEFEIEYPQGYLEAQEAKRSKKEKENESKTPTKRGTKRKSENTSLKPLSDFLNGTTPKKMKTDYQIPVSVEEEIKGDTLNIKCWDECREVAKDGKKQFLSKVEEIFMCICCQDLLFQPVTTDCRHNICKSCLERSFVSEIYSCPCCRKELDKNCMNINQHLSKALSILFPGYEAARK